MSRFRGILRGVQASSHLFNPFNLFYLESVPSPCCGCRHARLLERIASGRTASSFDKGYLPLAARTYGSQGVGRSQDSADDSAEGSLGALVGDSLGDVGGSLTGSRKDKERLMMIIYTCNKCEARSGKTFSKQAYEKGVVIVTCPGCDAKHLVADNLGWFGEESNIEELLRERVEKADVGMGPDGTLTLTERLDAAT